MENLSQSCGASLAIWDAKCTPITRSGFKRNTSWNWNTFSFWTFNESGEFAYFSEIRKRKNETGPNSQQQHITQNALDCNFDSCN